MGWKCVTTALMMVLLLVTGARGEPRPVVVELYTSQGCSSCPPADQLLRDLSSLEYVIPLALHVDYWDYIGWKDSFAKPAHSQRQRAYARAVGQRTVHTPQMIVNGVDHLVGTKPMKLAELIEKHRNRPSEVSMSAKRHGDVIRIRARSSVGSGGPMILQLVRYLPERAVSIGRGENAGRTIAYSNIVTELTQLGIWNGLEPLNTKAVVSGDEPIVVLLQRAGHGPIVAAVSLR